jgi:hypothetical protein
MNEMDQLARFRDEIPPGVTPRAERMFRTALEREISSEHHVLSPPHTGVFRRVLGRPRGWRPDWRWAIAVPVAAGLVAGILVAVQPSRPATTTTEPTTAELLADRAAMAALNQPNLSAGQWIYEVVAWSTPGQRQRSGPAPSEENGWMTADGTITYGGAGSLGDPIFPYNELDSLPRDPAKLNAYFRSLDPVRTDNNSVVEYGQIQSMLFGMVLPGWLEAEMFHALALIPDIQVRDNVKDILGRAGIAFVLPPTKQSEQLEIILDASDYHLLAQGSWDNPGTPSPDNETAIVQEYPVTQLGSTQEAISPPSAAEVAAEKIDFQQSHIRDPRKLIRYVPGDQWLYRELSVGGSQQEIWATADDSAQAEYVNGTLQVCERTNPCASSEQWLMPAGPSYSLVDPSYLGLTSAQLEQLRKLPVKRRQAALRKLLNRRAAKPLPTLPGYPQPLLAKLNTYSTGCADVADDCNAVNVAANVLTGYGNYPSLEATWFYALADVPGAGIQYVTDAAGNRDIAFTFPAQDGITAILVNATLLNAGTIQYEGYIRDGRQTLVLNQTLVSGPGVRP